MLICTFFSSFLLLFKNTLSNQCYHCGDDEDSKQGAVYDPMLCRKIKSCADDEVCRVTTLNTAGVFTYESGCNQKLQCQILTIATLQSENIDTGVDVASILASAGKRDNPTRKRQQSICDICCGDGLCNDSDCESVKIRIMQFANATRFNYTTLKLIR
ncbi:hypothetical protein ACJMK2_038717 [Sinanodonta woodiana]|uniref:Sodefrin-like factor n=1 Tax=Sinanodonta woodiana TaxID=1069815 RepID=A0ABD3W9V8_SINWO